MPVAGAPRETGSARAAKADPSQTTHTDNMGMDGNEHAAAFGPPAPAPSPSLCGGVASDRGTAWPVSWASRFERRNKRWSRGGMVMQQARVSVSPDSSRAVWGCYADSRLGFEATEESSSLPLNTQRECVGCCGCRHSNKRVASRRQGWSCLSRVCPWRTKTRAS